MKEKHENTDDFGHMLYVRHNINPKILEHLYIMILYNHIIRIAITTKFKKQICSLSTTPVLNMNSLIKYKKKLEK